MPGRNLAVLVGNGLSIAVNPSLGLGNITTELVRRMSASQDPQGEEGAVAAAMRRIADRYSPTGTADYSDFENIVGAFGGQSSMLDELTDMADLVEPANTELRDAIELASKFAKKVRDAGVTHVLEVIYEESRAHADRMVELDDLTAAIGEAFDGRVTFGNLNYDTLLLSSLLHNYHDDLADLGHGYRRGSITTNGGTIRRAVVVLRRSLDFPAGRRVRLLHLHGSLTFWGRKPENDFYKLETSFLDVHRPWTSVRSGGTKLRPAVVLANQKDKSGIIQQFPFSLAYRGFAAGLEDANHWLVVGYSFRDAAVNALFEEELRLREDPPKMLVVTFEDRPTRSEVEKAVGWDQGQLGTSLHWLTFDRGGAFGSQTRPKWRRFKS